MSISPVGGVSLHQQLQSPAAAKPEAAEVRGAPDHDGDADDAAKSSKVNVKA